MENKDKEIYVLLLLNYKNKYKDLDNIFPINWDIIMDYRLKSEILNEAINKNILIKDCVLYKNNT